MLHLIAVISSIIGASAQGTCFPAFQCEYYYNNGTDLWYWDLNGLCTQSGYITTQSGRPGSTFSYNICGVSKDTCDPVYNSSSVPRTAIAIQFADDACVLVGEGAPIFQPMDLKNPETGGIIVTHQAAPIELSDPLRCAPINDIDVNRKVSFNISCDLNVESLIAKPAIEFPECTFTIPIASKHGCGKRALPPAPTPAPAPTPTPEPTLAPTPAPTQAPAPHDAFGLQAAAAVGFMVLGAVLVVGGWAGIHYCRHNQLPFRIPGVSIHASGAAPAVSLGDTTGSGYGSSTAYDGAYTSTA